MRKSSSVNFIEDDFLILYKLIVIFQTCTCMYIILILFSIHGNDVGDVGMKKLAKALLFHPHITSLDVGDCNLSDDSVESICNLLPPHGKKSGCSIEQQLFLTAILPSACVHHLSIFSMFFC